MGLTGRNSVEFIFAVGEALANAVEHGFREHTFVTVRIHRVSDPLAIVVDVEDDGPGFNAEQYSDDTSSSRGFGMRIMEAMADRIEFGLDGRRVRLWKRQAAWRHGTRRSYPAGRIAVRQAGLEATN